MNPELRIPFINLASGQRPFARPFYNVDIQSKWNPDVVCDILDMPIFPDESAQMIVVHHGLEHLTMAGASKGLKEWHRILAPGGSLIIAIPDLKELAYRWLSGRVSDYIFFVNCMGADMGDPADIHRWHYTAATLEEELRKDGEWSEIKRFDWRQIPGADIARDDAWIQCWEAVK